MSRRRLEMKLDPEEDKLILPSSSEDEEENSNSEASDEEPVIEDPFAKEDDDSDSDSAPEALSFRDAMEDNRAMRHHTTQVIRTQMEERRRKRKEIHDELLLKKEEKRRKIESKMLPDDFLEDLEDNPFPVKAKSRVEEKDESEGERLNDDEAVIPDVPTTGDVLAIHGSTVFKCKALKEESRKAKHVPETIVNFKDQLLYGGRIRRERSARDGMLKRTKQLVHQGLKPMC